MLIIPPVSEKTTYFNNETIRALWREAGKALRDASTVYIIGYSLPPSDLGMQMFLRGNQPSPKTRVFVVDINAKVVDHIGNILRDCEMRNEFAGPGDRVARFVNHYRKESP